MDNLAAVHFAPWLDDSGMKEIVNFLCFASACQRFSLCRYFIFVNLILETVVGLLKFALFSIMYSHASFEEE